MVKECVVYIYSLLQTDVKQGGGSVAVSVMFRVFAAGTDVRNLALLNPGEPHWAVRAPVSNKYQQKSLAPHNNTIKSWTLPPFPPPDTEVLSSRDSDSSYHNSTDPLLDYSHPAQWLLGASRPRLPTQMGVQACDDFHMSHRSFEPVRFFKCFSFHLSSLSLFCSLKPLDQGGRGEHLRRWKRSNLMPINTF